MADAVREETPTVGGELRVTFACPSCNHTGWVVWKNLGRGMRCCKCKSRFLIGRDGQLCLHVPLPPIKFECPRCRHSGYMPNSPSIRGMECPECKIALLLGPNDKLYTEEGLADLKRRSPTTNTGRRAQRAAFLQQIHLTPMAVRRASYVALSGLLIFIGYRLTRESSLTELAQNFTYACLGDKPSVVHFVGDDVVQREELKRYRLRHFGSILDAHRPKGDVVYLDVRMLDKTEDRCVLEVTLSSKFLGIRSHEQVWILRNEQWRFDAVDTLGDQRVASGSKRTLRP